MTAGSKVCAVVVAYYPDAGLLARLGELLTQVDGLVVVDNTPEWRRGSELEELHLQDRNLRIIQNRSNLGVAAALNQGLEQALEWNCEWLLTLDQDSRCHSDMVRTLLRAKRECTPPPVVIGANYTDVRNDRTKVWQGEGNGFLDQKTVITSGSLVDVRFAQSIGGYREDYFIDQLDHEFCLRVRRHGGRVVISRRPVMDHSVGEAGGAWLPFLGWLPNHPPLRKYYIARNSIVTIADYWRREPDWCMRRLGRLLMGALAMPFLERNGLTKLRAFACGAIDGLRRRMGPCRWVWLCRE